MKVLGVVKPFRLGRSFVVTLPREAVEELGIGANTRLVVYLEGDRIILMPRERHHAGGVSDELGAEEGNRGELEEG